MISIEERHNYWWNFLLERVWVPDDFTRTSPTFTLTRRKSRVAGRASVWSCIYNLNYAVQEGDHYDETICHEVCHAFADRLVRGRAKHGYLWYYLFNIVCAQQRGRYHSYKMASDETLEATKKIQRLLKLQEKMKELDTQD